MRRGPVGGRARSSGMRRAVLVEELFGVVGAEPVLRVVRDARGF